MQCILFIIDMFRICRWHTLHTMGYRSILELAYMKLLPKTYFDKDGDSQLACLGIHIGLDFDVSHETGQDKELELAQSYMRIVFAAPEHHDFIHSGTPSEPILAEAAAQLLNELKVELVTPDVLRNAFQKGFLAQGEWEEVVGRLLWTLAHDWVLRDSMDYPMKYH